MADREYRIGNLIFLDHNHDGLYTPQDSGDSVQAENPTTHVRRNIDFYRDLANPEQANTDITALATDLGLSPRQLRNSSLEQLQNYSDALHAYENAANRGETWRAVMFRHSARLFARDYFCHTPEDAGYDVDCTLEPGVAARLGRIALTRNYTNVSDFITAAREALTRAQQAHNGNLPSGDDIQNVFDVLEAVENEMRSPNFPAAWRQNSAVAALAQEIASYSSRSEGNTYLAAVTRTEQHLNQNLIAHLGEVWDDLRDLNIPQDEFTGRPEFNLDTTLTSQVNNLRRRLYAKGIELAQAEKQRLQAEQIRLEQERTANIRRLETNLAEERANLARSQTELPNVRRRLEAARARLSAVQATITRLPSQISTLERQIDAAPFYRPDIYVPLRWQKSQAEDQLQNANQEKTDLELEIPHESSNVQHHERMIPIYTQAITRIEGELAQAREGHDFGASARERVRNQITEIDQMIALWTRALNPQANIGY